MRGCGPMEEPREAKIAPLSQVWEVRSKIKKIYIRSPGVGGESHRFIGEFIIFLLFLIR
jgi:hypothetical protein